MTAAKIKADHRVESFERDGRGMWWVDLRDGWVGPCGAPLQQFETVREAARWVKGVRRRK